MKFSEIVAIEIDDVALTAMPMTQKPDIRIVFAPDGQRARIVISRSNAKATGKHPSWKMKRMMHYESPPEHDVFHVLEVCSDVGFYWEQSCGIYYEMDGVEHIHYPDVFVKTPSKKFLVEVKTAADAARPEIARRTAFLKQALPFHGYEYRIVTAEHLAKSPRLENANKLIRHGYQPVPMIRREQIRQIFKANDRVCWGMFKLGSDGGQYHGHICRLILEGTLSFDFNSPLVDESPIQAANDFNGGASWE